MCAIEMKWEKENMQASLIISCQCHVAANLFYFSYFLLLFLKKSEMMSDWNEWIIFINQFCAFGFWKIKQTTNTHLLSNSLLTTKTALFRSNSSKSNFDGVTTTTKAVLAKKKRALFYLLLTLIINLVLNERAFSSKTKKVTKLKFTKKRNVRIFCFTLYCFILV